MNHIGPLSWKLYPDVFAQKASKGRWKIYKWLELVSTLITPMIIRGNARILLSAPPQHGKSEFFSNWLPTWFLHNFQEKKVILGTYSQSYANKWGTKVRENLVRNPISAISMRADTQSKQKFLTSKGGQMMVAGVDGPATGEGADCFPAGTLISTEIGMITIDVLSKMMVPPRVLGYNTVRGKPEWCEIKATKIRRSKRFVYIVTEKGRAFWCTSEHLIYIPISGYRKAALLRTGDELLIHSQQKIQELPDLWDNSKRKIKKSYLSKMLRSKTKNHDRIIMQSLSDEVQTDSMRGRKKSSNEKQHVLLQRSMSIEQAQYSQTEEMSEVWKAMHKKDHEILLQKMQAIKKEVKPKALRFLQSNFPTHQFKDNLLFQNLCNEDAFVENDWRKKFPFQKWRKLFKTVRRNETFDNRAGQELCNLSSNYTTNANSSCGCKSSEQYTEKFGASMSHMSCSAPQIDHDTVALVGEICTEDIDVYDIQVEGCSNFFANEILAHNCLIVDDPYKNPQEAMSPVIREKVNDWFRAVASTRIQSGGSAVVMHTRWMDDDLIGELAREQGWIYINLPAICEDPESDLLKRSKGEALCPERYTVDDLALIRRQVTDLFWFPLYQGSAVDIRGSIVKREDIQFYDDLPKMDEVALFCDLTYEKDEENDYAVFEAWGRKGVNVYLIDQIRAQMGITEQMEALERMVKAYPTAFHKEIEKKANGAAVIELCQTKFPGLIANNPQTSKGARLAAVSPIYKSGNVWYPNPKKYAWVETNLYEIARMTLAGPKSKNDDTVDCASMAVAHFGKLNTAIARLTALSKR